MAIGRRAPGDEVPGAVARAAGLKQEVLVLECIVKSPVQPGVVVPVVALEAFRTVEVDHVDAASVGDPGEVAGHLPQQRRVHVEHVIAIRTHEVCNAVTLAVSGWPGAQVAAPAAAKPCPIPSTPGPGR